MYNRVELEMKKITIIIFILLINLLILGNTAFASTGFGPAEIFCHNTKDTYELGTASLINGGNEDKYGVFALFVPYTNLDTWRIVDTEIPHARVICNHCGMEMQRMEAIVGYMFGMSLVGTCTRCGSNDLCFYDTLPRDEFQHIWLETAGNFTLEETSDHTWITKEKIPVNGACNVKIMYDASDSYIIENFAQHWEFHLRGSLSLKKDTQGFMVPGIDLRVLFSFKFPMYITIVSPIEKGEPFIVRVEYGDSSGSWGEIVEPGTKIVFNGEIQYTNEKGEVTFVFPDDRGDYEYDLTAEGNEIYDTTTMIIDEDTDDLLFYPPNNTEQGFLFSFYFWVMITIICIIVVTGLVVWREYYSY